ncbi:energy-coupling factor ABC transporter ATP-binding protein [Peptostreptococcus porci]|uniref:energy-coupling factor ABC transporter ATP-binding protein n=1 Tax=Peptostreptococcus porci TaxID=2652282 RepID=UPI0023F2638E|nr:ABC transporter ATP-binding protein [Peptostreptococcus porci]MDD7183737.1 ABC transporter ATP-binding protein [Peptostreptococcus porci]MDY5963637.1 ABC transporter ATP-binding protein [Peptostreptococcus porci]
MLGKKLIEMKKVSFSYNEEGLTLSDINIEIFKGDKIAVLGANGSGKSTFFMNLAGVLFPHTGEIMLNGDKITKKTISKLREKIGIVFQEPDYQIIASTVWSEVSFGPMNLNLSKDEVSSRVCEALKYMNLTQYAQRPPHYLSGGEKKRVTIADIIAMKSEIIIFDEPTSSLDPVNSEMLENTLSSLHDEGKTLIISTHDVDFAFRWADRIVVFDNGQIISDDIPENTFENDEVLNRSNLRKPIIMDMVDILIEKNILIKPEKYPKTITEFSSLL